MKFSCLFCFRSRLRNCIVTVSESLAQPKWMEMFRLIRRWFLVPFHYHYGCDFRFHQIVRALIYLSKTPNLSSLPPNTDLENQARRNSEHWVTNIHKSICFSLMKAPSWTAYPGLNAEAWYFKTLRLQIHIHLLLTHLSSNLVISLSYEQEEKSIFYVNSLNHL